MRIRIVSTASHHQAVQVVSKHHGILVVHKHIGTYHSDGQKQQLITQAQAYICEQMNQLPLFSPASAEWSLGDVEILTSQPLHLYALLSHIYTTLGFDDDPLIRDLVIARMYQPASKRETQYILTELFSRPYGLSTVYRHLKTAIAKGLKDRMQQAFIRYAKQTLQDALHLVFYDVTTLAFSSQTTTTLKAFGYSKDHRSQDTQLVIGLVVTAQGFPLYFDVFSGNTFEGGTFVTIVERIQALIHTQKLVVVADAGMLSQSNMDDLAAKDIHFIVGARISAFPLSLTTTIANTLRMQDMAHMETTHKNYRLLADYSSKRATKDMHDIKKQWEKAQAALTNPSAMTRRYRFLQGSKQTKYILNITLKEKAELTAGVKGYMTNTDLDAHTIIEKYRELWNVEKAFRVTKHDLEARPIFLKLDETIKAHVTIVFASLAIAKILEIQTHTSIHRIIAALSRIFTHSIRNRKTNEMTTMVTKIPTTEICGKLFKLYPQVLNDRS